MTELHNAEGPLRFGPPEITYLVFNDPPVWLIVLLFIGMVYILYKATKALWDQ